MGSEGRDPPEQLPIVLQVLLSQVHRLRALDLLGRFLDLGPWAVNLVSFSYYFKICLLLLMTQIYIQLYLIMSVFFFAGIICWYISLCFKIITKFSKRVAAIVGFYLG